MEETRNNSIVLMGLKHCGKTTQGKLLAEKLNVPFFDTDAVIEQMVGMNFRTYYAANGPAAFCIAEEAACKKIIEENKNQRIVVSTGGGICDNPPALNVLRQLDKFVLLKLDIEYSVARIMSKIKQNAFGTIEGAPAYVMEKNPKNLVDVKAILTEKFQARVDQYLHICDIVVQIKNASIEENFKTLSGTLL